ncbi:electron transfer flavoprotein subunit beta/FixA family protein [Desulfotomaculum copahuensis]|uniref:Electron transfer flavoprotein small subunit n=1 Tax=Desulfotomaculum copahuensis TaxID=1838280 RepID=A0A1B7LF44_9FIRM|nr:electron transfer flavoprotein subunit beta/FixA family protein [Desulfotomaculum copahuensis]OAT82276.1 electron transfer flavoprotein subunit beta [Desulfotomaculum copahuensis]
MHIVVLVKQVPATDNVRLDPEKGIMIRGAKDNIINPLDENAVAEAVRIKALLPEATVTALAMGPEAAREVLREAAARGADRGVLLSGRAYAGADTIATSRALAAAIKKLSPVDLVLAGERATDGETGQTGPMVAARLDMPVVTYVRKVDWQDGVLQVERIVEDGYEQVEVTPPALLTVVKDINKPRPPSLKRRLKALKMEVPVWGPEDLALAANELGLKGSPTRVVKVFSPRLVRQTRMFGENETTSAIDELLRQLTARNVV